MAFTCYYIPNNCDLYSHTVRSLLLTNLESVFKFLLSLIQCAELEHTGTKIRPKLPSSVAYRGGFWGVQIPPRNSEDIGGVLDRMSKKDRRLDFLL